MARTKQATIIQVPTDEEGLWRDWRPKTPEITDDSVATPTEFDDTGDAIKAVKAHKIAKFRIVRIADEGGIEVEVINRVKIAKRAKTA